MVIEPHMSIFCCISRDDFYNILCMQFCSVFFYPPKSLIENAKRVFDIDCAFKEIIKFIDYKDVRKI